MPADASHHSMPSHLRPSSFDLQHGTTVKSSISNLSDCGRDHAGHRRSMPPASKRKNAFYSMTRRVLNEISAALALDFDKEAKARRRRHAELERRRFTRPSPSYGCATIMVNQELYDVPTLAHESGLRHVRNANALSSTLNVLIILCSSSVNINWITTFNRHLTHLNSSLVADCISWRNSWLG
jgi:hypothetical protein